MTLRHMSDTFPSIAVCDVSHVSRSFPKTYQEVLVLKTNQADAAWQYQ